MICCLCTPENTCGPGCLRHPPHVRRRNLRPAWWRIDQWVRRAWLRFRSWRRRRYFLKHGYKFPVIKAMPPALSIDDVVCAEPQLGATGTGNHIPWKYSDE